MESIKGFLPNEFQTEYLDRKINTRHKLKKVTRGKSQTASVYFLHITVEKEYYIPETTYCPSGVNVASIVLGEGSKLNPQCCMSK